MKTYHSTGFVWGNLWGGGQGGYRAKPLNGFESEETLVNKAEEMLKNGSLDGGMGYESLEGALLTITEIETIEKDGKEFKHEDSHIKIIGNVPEEMVNVWYNIGHII